jgi:uncharacterized protein (TIGR02285 family)
MKFLSGLLTLLLLAVPCASWADTLRMLYPERPPYNYTENGKAAGLLVEQTEKILMDANIPAVFVEVPSKRILAEIQLENSTACSFGWFKTAEREALANFTLPTYRDTPLVALILKRNEPRFANKLTLRDMASDKELTLGLISGWSYGGYVDGVLKLAGVVPMAIPERQHQALMLASERFAYTLIRTEEIPDVVRLSGKPLDSFAIVPLTDLHERNLRYIMCGRGVPAETIKRINTSIEKYCKIED